MAKLQIDVEAVNSAVNRIDTLTTDIETRTKKFIEHVKEMNDDSKNSVALLVNLNQRLQEEHDNIVKLIEAQEEIKESLSRYASNLADIADGSELA